MEFEEPLVSVICISFNHSRFVREALDSVVDQTYPRVELIVVDDASTDDSAAVIKDWIAAHPQTRFLPLHLNGGNCRAFNTGLREAKGKYVIDLSADDVLMPDRITKGVALLESRPEAGVQFSDAELIDSAGRHLGFHSDRFPHGTVPQGKIFSELLARYFINSPTMMMRKELLDSLGGYDESLAYEDFDFWIRSAKRTEYTYLPEALVRRRTLPLSMGKQQYTLRSRQARSTLIVCRKALTLCSDALEFRGLRTRIAYEMRQALRVGNFSLAWDYFRLLRKVPGY